MTGNILFLPLILPFLAAILALCLRKGANRIVEILALIVTGLNLLLCAFIFKSNITYSVPWLNFGIDFSLRLYNFSAFIILASAFFAFLTVLYSTVFMKAKQSINQFYAYLLITLAFVNGAVLADNLVLLLFFWEGLLLTLFAMIYIGGKTAYKAATKAFIIMGISDLCLMAGVGLTWHIAQTATISKISLPINSLSALAFTLLMIGAISKAGSMPFHSWIPDAAVEAPLPFMSFMPASIDKLLGIYFLTRISMDLFKLSAHSALSTMMMAIGAITILLAVMMALVQKDYKRLLSYHAISQAGYMILGIGTCLPVGIIGGIFHMVNNALYKSCLFFTGGAAENATGTSDLSKLGGLRLKMPVTCACFIITAMSISGVPPFNGFFSKELVYDAAWERGLIFYLAAIGGSFLTALSFLKLGHAAFFGKLDEKNKNVKEAPMAMLIPMIVIAAVCIIFGVFNSLPITKIIQPILGAERMGGHNYAGMPKNAMFVIITILVLIAAFLHHYFMAKKTGSGLHAADDIHYAPLLSSIYAKAEKRFFDPYTIGGKITRVFSRIAWGFDRLVDWVCDGFTVGITYGFSYVVRAFHTGYYPTYILWSVIGMGVIVFLILR